MYTGLAFDLILGSLHSIINNYYRVECFLKQVQRLQTTTIPTCMEYCKHADFQVPDSRKPFSR